MTDAPPDQRLPDLLTDLADGDPAGASESDLASMLESMVLHPDYPCLGARSVFQRERAEVVVLEHLGTQDSGETLRAALTDFAAGIDLDAGFASLVAVFREDRALGEAEFERALWEQLRLIHEADDREWDPAVSSDPDSPHFAFSVGGTAFFVVGLHPGASRIARRTPLPTLVFNLHEQFEELRASDRFERMRDTIRRRDTELQGSPNPMVADHGRSSEARQYSGRSVAEGWQAPASFDDEEAPA